MTQTFYRSLIEQAGGDILNSERFKAAGKIMHHGSENVAVHSLRVAQQACRLAEIMQQHGIRVNMTDIIRASLLHDIGMTEDQVNQAISPHKAYLHPRQGARIAAAEFHANDIQKQAVGRHMWPINVIPPTHLTGWIVLVADKLVSMREIEAQHIKGKN